MSKYKTYSEVIEAWGADELAIALGQKRNTVDQWKFRNKIPNKFHWKIATKRKARELNINMRLLEKLGQ